MTSATSTYLVSDPDYRGGRLCIAGTGISVARIGVLLGEGNSPEQIWRDVFEEVVSLDTIHAAIAYYLANRAEIDAEIDRQDAELDRVARANRAPVG